MTLRTTVLTGLTALTLAAANGVALANGDASASPGQPAHATEQAQGMYSIDNLRGAPVYAKDDDQHAVGKISDVLLNNDMKIRSFVVETHSQSDASADKSYVVSPNELTVQSRATGKATQPDYRIELGMTRAGLTDETVYNDSWWSNAQNQARNAWQHTEHAAASAWTQFKGAASDITQNRDTSEAVKRAAGNTHDQGGASD